MCDRWFLCVLFERFPLVLLQAKVVGTQTPSLRVVVSVVFPLVLLQAKVVGPVSIQYPPKGENMSVSISSPSSEGGGANKKFS